jgi:hypothetical protein
MRGDELGCGNPGASAFARIPTPANPDLFDLVIATIPDMAAPRVARKNCFSSSFGELNIIPIHLIVSSEGFSRPISLSSFRAS